MKAIRVHRFGGPEVMVLEEVPVPTAGPGQVVVRVRAAGVNPVETYIRSGQYGALPPLPFTPGSDAAGEIVEVGPGVSDWTVGDRVFFFGTAAGRMVGAYGEVALCSAKGIYRLPDRISFAQGAALGVPYATAYRGIVRRGAARPGETLLVHGASGGVGTAAVQIGRWKGLTVIGTAGTPEGVELVRRLGAQHALNHRAAGYQDEIRKLTGGKGVDVVLEMLANVNLDADLGLIGMGGRVVVIGNRGRIEIDPRQTMSKDASIAGMALWNTSDEELRAIYTDLVSGLASGALTPVIAEEIPLGEAPRAHERVMQSGAHGKIVLVP